MKQFRIRPFTAPDRPAIRRIAWETGDSGNPPHQWFGDPELFADLITRYYTDLEPQSAWVLECDGRITGYLTGCTDTHQFLRAMGRHILPRAIFSALRRRLFLDERTRRWIRLNLPLWLNPRTRRHLPLATHPAHLHINLLPEARGENAGRELLELYLEKIPRSKIPGIHASTREDNMCASRFFEKMSFQRLSRQPLMRIVPGPSGLLYSSIFGRLLT